MRWTALLILAFSCAAGPNVVAGAAVSTAVALTASGASRAQGGCYASCPTGTTCNRATGYCDELPCRGRCGPSEYCDEKRTVPMCISRREPDLQIQRGDAPVK